ncbi:MAG: CBS domain-containing protein [bacterium]|nr:CBS domain-containing protein [bacterium]MCP5069589.1 CBS domain-containing protein [bacterium]
MSVGSHCRRSFSRAQASETIRDAAKRMKCEDAGCLVVVDEKDRPIGTLTDRDVAMQVLRRNRDPDQTAISEVMHEEITCLWESTPLLTAFRRMRADGLRRIPVVDDGGKAIGVMEWDDALQIIATELDQVARVAKSQWTQAQD